MKYDNQTEPVLRVRLPRRKRTDYSRILYPRFGCYSVSRMFVSAAMTFNSVSVIGNALSLRRVEL